MDFLGEEAEDGGGPKREFWALIAKDVNLTFEGPVDRKIPLHDVIGLQVAIITALHDYNYMHNSCIIVTVTVLAI